MTQVSHRLKAAAAAAAAGTRVCSHRQEIRLLVPLSHDCERQWSRDRRRVHLLVLSVQSQQRALLFLFGVLSYFLVRYVHPLWSEQQQQKLIQVLVMVLVTMMMMTSRTSHHPNNSAITQVFVSLASSLSIGGRARVAREGVNCTISGT